MGRVAVSFFLVIFDRCVPSARRKENPTGYFSLQQQPLYSMKILFGSSPVPLSLHLWSLSISEVADINLETSVLMFYALTT